MDQDREGVDQEQWGLPEFNECNQRKWGPNEQIEGLHTKTLGPFASHGGF